MPCVPDPVLTSGNRSASSDSCPVMQVLPSHTQGVVTYGPLSWEILGQ